jgi:tetratricopeptide (TPR) repeat protein
MREPLLRNCCMWSMLFLLLPFFAFGPTVPIVDDGIVRARQARDRGDVDGLETLLKSAHEGASQTGSLDSYIRIAVFADWLVEAAQDHQNDKLIKRAAEEGVAAAETAAKLSPNSSEAHRLLGELLGELIPHVFAGGIRYGERSTKEIERAIQLDPHNPNAYVARATSYFFTPQKFGGSKEKAADMLKKAIATEPDSDAAETAHVWLAVVYQALGQKENAVSEITQAVKLNPERQFTLLAQKRILSQ